MGIATKAYWISNSKPLWKLPQLQEEYLASDPCSGLIPVRTLLDFLLKIQSRIFEWKSMQFQVQRRTHCFDGTFLISKKFATQKLSNFPFLNTSRQFAGKPDVRTTNFPIKLNRKAPINPAILVRKILPSFFNHDWIISIIMGHNIASKSEPGSFLVNLDFTTQNAQQFLTKVALTWPKQG